MNKRQASWDTSRSIARLQPGLVDSAMLLGPLSPTHLRGRAVAPVQHVGARRLGSGSSEQASNGRTSIRACPSRAARLGGRPVMAADDAYPRVRAPLCPTSSLTHAECLDDRDDRVEVSREIAVMRAASCARHRRRPCTAELSVLVRPLCRRYLLFNEYFYFHSDNGAGLGASHQTGWTGLVAMVIELYGRIDGGTC